MMIGMRCGNLVDVKMPMRNPLPSVGSVVPRDVTHAIAGRCWTLYELLAVAAARLWPKEMQRFLPDTDHTAPKISNKHSLG